ncbi:MAG: hypothetical protein ACKPKO_38210, partial [Candidatus Fonsibacter sp.]
HVARRLYRLKKPFGPANVLQLHEEYQGRVQRQLLYNRGRVHQQADLICCCSSLFRTCCACTIWSN